MTLPPGSASPVGPLLEPGDHPVDTPITCVLSRFGLRSARHLLPSYRDYRQVVRELTEAQVPGFLRAAFLVESPTTWYSLSLWAGSSPISHFGTQVPMHINAARRVFGRLADDGDGPELWSTKWRLVSVSNNLNWPGFDLRNIVLDLGRNGHHAG